MNEELSNLNWDKVNGLMPVIVQDSMTLQVLMLGYMNQEALTLTCEINKVTFFSRTKNRLWTKGETSGHYLSVDSIVPDCDNDTLLILATPSGPTCHLGYSSCFGKHSLANLAILSRLENIIEQRYKERSEASYVSRLFNEGIKRIAQKVGEEGVETAIAGVAEEDQSLINEAADLLFHLLILLVQRQIRFSEVLHEINRRM